MTGAIDLPNDDIFDGMTVVTHDDANAADTETPTKKPVLQEASAEPKVGEYVGQCKWFNDNLGFGFITIQTGEGKGRDIFVHHSGIKPLNSNYKTLKKGEYINFDIVEGENGQQAVNVTGIGGGSLICDVTPYHKNVYGGGYVPVAPRVYSGAPTPGGVALNRYSIPAPPPPPPPKQTMVKYGGRGGPYVPRVQYFAPVRGNGPYQHVVSQGFVPYGVTHPSYNNMNPPRNVMYGPPMRGGVVFPGRGVGAFRPRAALVGRE